MDMNTLERKQTDAVPSIIDGDALIFRENFNIAAFQFSHRLTGNPLFELPRLVELARSLPDADIYYDAGDIRVDQRWDQTPRTRLSVDQLIDRIENAGAWILIRRAEKDRRYAAILDQTLAEVRGLVGNAFPMKIMCPYVLVFITSPNRLTTYHIDRECNYLFQIQGDKVISIFDRFDRDVLPEEEIERFWTVDNNAAVYKERYQERAHEYRLSPGTAVHIPVNAPHWVKNANNISVTVGMVFQFPQSCLANVYRANHYLRKVGIKPLPPGRSWIRDGLKTWTIGTAIGGRNVLRRILGHWRST
jgi:hypothetical protein